MTDDQSFGLAFGVTVTQGRTITVFAGAISTETNVFSPIPSDMQSFRSHLYEAAGALDASREESWPIPLEAFRRSCRHHGWKIVQGLCTAAPPGGSVPQAVYEVLRDQLLADLQAALPVDIVALSLHGAMIATGCDDCEGDILRRVRALVGPDVVVGAVLDPHAHLTPAMIENATVMVFFKEYPHTDVFESAHELIELLGRCREGGARPVAAVFDCRMIGFYFTDREPMRGFVAQMRAIEKETDVLSVSLVHGFPWGDTPAMGTKMLVYTDARVALAERLSRTLGLSLFERRGHTMPDLLTIDDMLLELDHLGQGPVVIADVADNPGGGAPGDATFLASALIKACKGKIAIGPFWDPLVVRSAFALGAGAHGFLRIGGKASPYSGAPLDLDVVVERLAPNAHQTVEGWAWPMGDTALLRAGAAAFVVTSERLQCINTDIFNCVGVDAAKQDVVVVKSAQHFRTAYAPFAERILYVDSPGALFLGSDASRYRHLTRPKWPFDENPFEGVGLQGEIHPSQ